MAPPLTLDAVDVETGVGLGMFELSLYILALAGVVTLVVVFRKPMICRRPSVPANACNGCSKVEDLD